MNLKAFFNYYKVGRFILVLTFLVSLPMLGRAYSSSSMAIVLAIYCLVAFARFFIAPHRVIPYEFALDIVFITAIFYLSSGLNSYLALLYLFPILTASILTRRDRIFLYPVLAGSLYIIVYTLNFTFAVKSALLEIILYFLSFSLIAVAGSGIKKRLDTQEDYIKALEDEKIRMKSYERLYRVSADLAHELRNPLASISASVQFLKEGKIEQDFIDMLDAETRRLTNLVNDFLSFSRPADAPTEKVVLAEAIKESSRTVRDGIKTTLHIATDGIIDCNRTYIEAAITNIMKNASEAAATEVKATLRQLQNDIIIWIEDDGPGISEEVKDSLFEPFVTTKHNGTGLGLAIAHRIITSYGGSISTGKSGMGGAKFVIRFTLPEKEVRVAGADS
ncbi:MAG: HAMP domain-containing sensor histidine kinase [Dissulfurispiraceae bacterium]|jgi:signal transduction histidine kinase|nr:HAMP domain-containing sensor histidine kinase [Dissulfurispiraceae bacterium]